MKAEHIKNFKPTSWAINNRTSVYLFTIFITIAGLLVFVNIPKERFPDIVVPTVAVTTIYPGSSPEDVENLITKPLEKQIKAISGIKKINSNSIQDVSIITVEFNTNVDVDVAKQKVSNAVDKAKKDLPSDLKEDPDVQEFDFSEFPIMNINISGDFPLEKLKIFAEDLQDACESINGVTRLDMIGALNREIQIHVDLYRMQALGIAFGDIEQAVASENVNISGGEIRINEQRRTLRVKGEFSSIEEIGNILVRSARGNTAYIKEFAEVKDGHADIQDFARLNGKPVITLNVIKKSGANLLQVSDDIKKIVKEFKASRFPSELEVVITGDTSTDTRVQLNDLVNTVIIGFILVVVVLMFFMGLRNAFFVALAVPLSVLLALLFMPSLGYTMNVIVLFSFLLALGIIVDDAIVVIENTHRIFHRYDFDIATSARTAAAEVFVPVLAGTLTTIAPFFPLLFWPGVVGEFMKYLPVTLILTLFASLFVAFIMNPIFAVSFMKKDEHLAESNPKTMKKPLIIFGITALIGYASKFYGLGNFSVLMMILTVINFYVFEPLTKSFQKETWPKMVKKYKALVAYMLSGARPYWVFVGVIGLLIFSFILFVTSSPKVEFFPNGEPNFAYVYIQLPNGTDAEVTDSITRIIEEKVYEVIGRDNPNVESVITNVGIGAGDPRNPDRVATPHKSKITVAFVDFALRKNFSTSEALEKIRENLRGIPAAEISVEKEPTGPPTGKPINIEIAGDDFDQLIELEQTIRRKIVEKKIEGIEELKSDLVRNKPEIIVDIDADRALSLGMSKAKIAMELRTALFGKEISKFKDIDTDAPIQLRLKPEYRQRVEDLLNMDIAFLDMATGRFKQVPASAVASIRYESAFSSINRKQQRRVVTLSSNVLKGYTANDIVKELNKIIRQINIPEGYTIKLTGEQEQQQESSSFLSYAFLASLALMFMILVTQFNSVVKPLIIFSTVVFSLIGVLLGFSIFNMNFSVVMTGVGIIALGGIVVRNGILLIEFADEMRARGMEMIEAIIEAGATRMTPVILTAITAILGLIPLAIGVNIDFGSLFSKFEPNFFLGGDNVAFWGPLAWTMIFGLIVSTFLTLLVVPSMYLIYQKIRKRVKGSY